MNACVIFNPAARGQKAARFRKELDSIGGACALKPTTCAGAARALASEAVREGFKTILAAGGDGTLNEVLNGIVDTPNGLAQTRLGVIPLGTVNVFARELGIPSRLEAAWQIIQAGHELKIDLPRASFYDAGLRQERAFIQMAGAGWDARAVEFVNWEIKKKSGQFAYVVAGLRALGAVQSRITVTDGKQTEVGELVLIGNGKFYGGSFSIFHQADYCDGWLDVCVFPKINWFSLPRYAFEMAIGNLTRPGSTIYFKAREIQLSCETQTGLQLEGELVGSLPAEISVLPKALRIITP